MNDDLGETAPSHHLLWLASPCRHQRLIGVASGLDVLAPPRGVLSSALVQFVKRHDPALDPLRRVFARQVAEIELLRRNKVRERPLDRSQRPCGGQLQLLRTKPSAEFDEPGRRPGVVGERSLELPLSDVIVLRSPSDDPDHLRRPAPRPRRGRRRVEGARRARFGSRLVESLDRESVVAKQLDPLDVWPAEGQSATLALTDCPESEVIALQLVGWTGLVVPTDEQHEHRGRAEDQPSAWAKNTCSLRYRASWIRPRHRSVIGEDQVERSIVEGKALSAGGHQAGAHALPSEQVASVLQLP